MEMRLMTRLARLINVNEVKEVNARLTWLPSFQRGALLCITSSGWTLWRWIIICLIIWREERMSRVNTGLCKRRSWLHLCLRICLWMGITVESEFCLFVCLFRCCIFCLFVKPGSGQPWWSNRRVSFCLFICFVVLFVCFVVTFICLFYCYISLFVKPCSGKPWWGNRRARWTWWWTRGVLGSQFA